MNEQILASYANLKSQVLPNVGLDRLEYRIPRIKRFATYNPSVTDLQFYSPSEVNVIDYHFRIGRDAKGKVNRILEVLENGMLYQMPLSLLGC